MDNSTIKRLLILGALAILGIIFIQGYWVVKTWNLKDQAFDSSVRIALQKTAESLASYNNSRLPKKNIIQRRSSNTYIVNINDDIDARVLEDYLIQNLEKRSLEADFEYGIYDCGTDNMLYGDYCDIGSNSRKDNSSEILPKFKDLQYYFVVRFPSKANYLISNMRQALYFSLIALLAIAFFIYATIIILKQRRLSEMQRDFINNMTHEFKTPIASIKLAANTLSKDQYIQADKRLSKYIQIVDEQSSRLNLQVEKLLGVAALDKGNLDLNFETIHLNELLQEIISDFELRVTELDGRIEFVELAKNVEVKVDKIHITNVIYNLLDNALKYSDNEVDIKVELGKKQLNIIDKGIGIDESLIKNVFKKFYRVPTGNVHNVKGFGLGLYYVKTILDKHNWGIDIDSKLNEGTKIKLNF